MKIIYLPLRFSLLILHVIFGLIILIFYPANNIGLKKIHHNISLYWMKILVMIFGLKIIQKGNIDTLASAFVCNHVSFLDIIILNSLIPANFIAKSEIKNWPIIGHLASKTGTIFVKRGDKDDIETIVGRMKSYLRRGKKIIFFPEGRIGDGTTIKKFHSKLFNSISYTNSVLQSISIRYPKDYPNNLDSDSGMCWTGASDMLIEIAIRCLSRRSTLVLINFDKIFDTTNKSSYELAKLSSESVCNSINNLR